jgi:uncharacterized protein
MILIDSSFLYALADTSDKYHHLSKQFLDQLTEDWLLPVTVLPEICYLLDSRLGHHAMRRFFTLVVSGELPLVHLRDEDSGRVLALLEEYGDNRLDFVDATIVALAERLRIERVLTWDRRHFRAIRPRHCPAFDLLP